MRNTRLNDEVGFDLPDQLLSKEDRAAKVAMGRYPHRKNNVEFYEAYLRGLRQLVQPLPDLVGEAVLSQASGLLVKRFGLPFLVNNRQ